MYDTKSVKSFFKGTPLRFIIFISCFDYRITHAPEAQEMELASQSRISQKFAKKLPKIY